MVYSSRKNHFPKPKNIYPNVFYTLPHCGENFTPFPENFQPFFLSALLFRFKEMEYSFSKTAVS